MNIEYVEPLSRAWSRMKKALFQPFDLRKWFVVGFTAFLAGLTDFTGGGGNGMRRHENLDWDEFLEFPQRAFEWLGDHPGWLILIVAGTVFLLTLFVVLTWLSSRGKFMFLDNVVHDRTLVAAPWSEFRREGNSLFLWRLGFGFLALLTVGFYLYGSFASLARLYHRTGDTELLLAPAIWMLLGFFGILLLVCFIDFLLTSFVVPIMYRHRLTVNRGWSRFLELFSSHPWPIIVFALFVLVLIIPVVFAVIVGGFMTCCVGFVILAIPYIGSVVLLPVHYLFRALSVEFLEQFGPEYRIFPVTPPVPPGGELHVP
ncbi:MAG: hypothetical protein WB699_10585 [Bacteroidota bacterium]